MGDWGVGGLERYSNRVGFMPTWKHWAILGLSDIVQGSLDIDKRTSLLRQGNKPFYSTGAWLRCDYAFERKTQFCLQVNILLGSEVAQRHSAN